MIGLQKYIKNIKYLNHQDSSHLTIIMALHYTAQIASYIHTYSTNWITSP